MVRLLESSFLPIYKGRQKVDLAKLEAFCKSGCHKAGASHSIYAFSARRKRRMRMATLS